MNRETLAIYCAGLLQGVTLVAFPAASTIITNSHDYAFSATAYGSLFIPQAILSIVASALNPSMTLKFGSKQIFIIGIIANLIAMLLLFVSILWMHHFKAAYCTLFIATAMLGLGFGLVVPTLNETLALLVPTKINFMLLILNALLGVGTALAPLLILLFVQLGFWWGLPVVMVCLLCLLLLFSLKISFPNGSVKDTFKQTTIPKRFWIFAAFALLYGIIETLNGNWASIYMKSQMDAPIKIQTLALAAFWGMVTFGRVFFALIDKFFKETTAFQLAPFIAMIAFIIITLLPSGSNFWGICTFGLAGLGCSVLLPLIISFGTIQLKTIAASVPGLIIACYLLGYGIAAFGVGPLEESAHLTLRENFLIGAVVAFILGMISFAIVQDKGEKYGHES